jgi:hypothetical protein
MAVGLVSTGIQFPDATIQTTAATASTGTVSSVATGNGLSGGTITTSGTLTIAAPSSNSVGSYAFVQYNNANQNITFGNNYSAGSGANQISAANFSFQYSASDTANATIFWERNVQLSGTWKWMGGTGAGALQPYANAIAVRVS